MLFSGKDNSDCEGESDTVNLDILSNNASWPLLCHKKKVEADILPQIRVFFWALSISTLLLLISLPLLYHFVSVLFHNYHGIVSC